MLSASLTVGSTNLVELTGLQDTVTGSYPTDATVTAQLLEPKGTPVVGAESITLGYVAGTSGADTTYRGAIPATVALGAKVYTLVVTATDASGNKRVFTVQATAQVG
jgi:hypothetical protein